MKKLFKLLLIIGLFWCNSVSASQVAVNADDARTWAHTKGHQLLTILSENNIIEKHSKLDKMISEDVNVDYISKFVIGKYGRMMNKSQKERYSDLFQRYVSSLYKRFNLRVDTQKIKFTVDDVITHARFTTVSCSVDLGDLIQDTRNFENVNKLPVKFKLIRGTNSRIQAIDVEISNVSMVMEYRKRFYQMIKDEDEDLNWFLDKFNDTVVANENSVYKKAGMPESYF